MKTATSLPTRLFRAGLRPLMASAALLLTAVVARADTWVQCLPCYGIGMIQHTCWGCNGSGEVIAGWDTCWNCNGTGNDETYNRPCGICKASGYIDLVATCSTCSGIGRLWHICGTCDGAGGYWVPTPNYDETVGKPIDGSPGVSGLAYDAALAALDGGNRYAAAFVDNIVTTLNPQTWADGIGALVGYVANIADPGTRTQVVSEVKVVLDELQSAQAWKDAAAHAMSPEGLATITSNAVLDIVPTPFGDIKTPDVSGISALNNVPDGVSRAQSTARIGATGRIGEKHLEDLHNAHINGVNRQVRIRTNHGDRVIDVVSNGVAHESKVGYTYLSPAIERQLQKDIDILNGQHGIHEVVWHFFVSPTTGIGHPSGPLVERINQLRAQGNNIRIEIHP